MAGGKRKIPTGGNGVPSLWNWVLTSSHVADVRKEADSASSVAPGILAGTNDHKPHKAESSHKKESGVKSHIICKLREAAPAPVAPPAGNRFRVVLIEEGMGNLADRFFYTKDAINSCVTVFEGKKIFLDHPASNEEQTRPERSVRDIVGHYENCAAETLDGGALACVADLVLVKGAPFDQARDLMLHSLDYKAKFPDQEFIGLSINAAGDAEEMPIDEFLKSYDVPKSALPKIQEAQQMGLDTLRKVSVIEDADSCDMVTEAGAKGRILKLLEKGESKKMAKNKESHEAGFPPKAGAPAAPGAAPGFGKAAPAAAPQDGGDGGGDAGHADADQDKALIASMMKKHLGDDAQEGDAGMAENYAEAVKFMQSKGHQGEAAHQMAAHAIQCAKHMQAKHEAKETEAKEAKEAKEKEDKECHEAGDLPPPAAGSDKSAAGDKASEKKESAKSEIVEIRAELASLREAARVRDVTDHVKSLLESSGLPRHATAEFKKALGTPKSKEEATSLFESFKKAFTLGKSSETDAVVFAERKTEMGADGEVVGFQNCKKK